MLIFRAELTRMCVGKSPHWMSPIAWLPSGISMVLTATKIILSGGLEDVLGCLLPNYRTVPEFSSQRFRPELFAFSMCSRSVNE